LRRRDLGSLALRGRQQPIRAWAVEPESAPREQEQPAASLANPSLIGGNMTRPIRKHANALIAAFSVLLGSAWSLPAQAHCDTLDVGRPQGARHR
jgi:hypothetical protein